MKMKKYKIKSIPEAKDGMSIKESIQESIKKAAKKYGLDENILMAQVQQESSFNPQAYNPSSGARGLAQFIPSTAKQYGLTKEDLTSTDPSKMEKVVDSMARYVSDLKDKYQGSVQHALAAYNAGPGTVDNYLSGKRKSLPKETLNYLQKINPTGSWVPQMQTPRKKFNEPVPAPGSLDPLSAVPQPLTPIDAPKFQTGRTSPDQETELPVDFQGRPLGEGMLAGIPSDLSNYTSIPQTKQRSAADRNKLRITDFLGETAALLDRPDYVQGQSFEPQLLQPYTVSLQDRLNQNNSTFRAATQVTNNPEALAALAGQKYEADNQVLSEQFRLNQGIQNDVYNKNVGTINQAALQNLQLADQQYVRQAQAKSNTDMRKQAALASVANKFNQKRSENTQIRLMENMFNYRPDQNMNLQYTGDPFYINTLNNPQTNSLTTPFTSTKTRVSPNGDINSMYSTPSQMEQKKLEYENFLKYQEYLQAQGKALKSKWGTSIKKMK